MGLMKRVSQCHGADIYKTPSDVTICSACDNPCEVVLKGEEMKPIEGSIFCQACAGKLSGQVPKELVLRYPASHGDGKGTCWGCGTTIRLQRAGRIVKNGT